MIRMTSIKFSGFQNLPRGRPEPERRGGSPKLAEADERGPLNSERRHALRRESSRPASRCRAVRPAGNVGGHCRRALSAGIVGGQCHGAVARVCANTATHPPCSALPVNLAPRFAGLPFFTGAFPRARFHGRVSTGAFPRARFQGRGVRGARGSPLFESAAAPPAALPGAVAAACRAAGSAAPPGSAPAAARPAAWGFGRPT
jgi:hypothetical protein